LSYERITLCLTSFNKQNPAVKKVCEL